MEINTDIREDAKHLARNIEQTYMALAKILFEVSDATKKTPLFQTWGYSSFTDYAEKELGIKSAKAQYLKKIYYRLEVELSGLDTEIKARITKLGLTKVRHLVRVLTVNNCIEWVERAESETALSLQMAVEQYMDEFKKAELVAQQSGNSYADINKIAMPPKIKYTPFNAYLPEDKAEVVEAALNLATKMINNPHPSKEQLLSIICSDFLAAYPQGTAEQLLQERLYKLEKLLGIQLVAQQAGKIIFGADTLYSIISNLKEDSDENPPKTANIGF